MARGKRSGNGEPERVGEVPGGGRPVRTEATELPEGGAAPVRDRPHGPQQGAGDDPERVPDAPANPGTGAADEPPRVTEYMRSEERRVGKECRAGRLERH